MDQHTLLFVSIFWLLAALFATPLRAGEAVVPSADSPAAIWIDVRTAAEYQSGHLDGAVNIPYDQIGSRIATLAPDLQQPLQLYCRSGHRAGIAKQTLETMGYTHVHNVGGYQQATAAQAQALTTSH